MWYNDYVGIPFLAKGREKTGVDCWGLACLVYEEQFNITLPSFNESYDFSDTDRIAQLAAQYKEAWEGAKEPKPGSLILFRILGEVSHVGIYIGNNKFLHCRENYSSAIESLDSTRWNKRVEGFYNYAEKSAAVLNVVPHPLRTERWTVPVPSGTTVAQLSEWVLEKFEVSKELQSTVTIIRNGVVVPKEEYTTTIILDSDSIEYRAVPGKDLIRIALMIAIIVVAVSMGQPYLAEGATGLMGMTAAHTAIAVTVGVSTLGNLLLGYLMPIRPPSSKDPGSAESQLLLSGGGNSVSKYAAIPVVLGKVRMTPILGGENYVDSNTDNSYLNMLLVWGFGPLVIDQTSLRIGLNSFSQYENGAGIPIEHYHLNDTLTPDDNADLLNFNALYGSDRQQVYSGVALVMHTTPTDVNIDDNDGQGKVGPWVEATLKQTNTAKIDVSLHFPQGLRQLRISGKNAGDIYDLEAKFQVQVRELDKNGIAQTSPLSGSPVPTVWGDAMVATTPATSIIVKQAYNTVNNVSTAKYQWTRIGVGVSGIQVKVGPLCAEVNSTYGIDGVGFGPRMRGVFSGDFGTIIPGSNYPNQGVRLPSWPVDVYPLADICMYGNTVVPTTPDLSVKSSKLSGFGITVGEVNSIDYSTTSWANPTVGLITGDKIFSIAAGTCTRSTNSIISLGTDTSGLFKQRKDAFSYTVTTAVATIRDGGYYQVRVRRLTTDTVDTPDSKNKNLCVIVFQTATATATNKPIREGSSSWRLTKSAIRIKANDQLNSRIEGINAIVTTICKDWNGTKWTISDKGSNNPASLFLYMLEHPANAYRIAPDDLDSRINMAALGTWWNFCNDAANKFTFNSVVSSQRSVLEILKDICAAGRASPAMVDGKWTVVIDTQKPDIIQHFTPHNSWGFEATKRLPKQPHALRISYINANSDYQEDEAIIYNAGYGDVASAGVKAAEIFEQITLPGITDYTTITKHARWHLAQAALRPEVYTLNTDLEYLVCNRGDRVKVMHDVPLWGMESGRIKSAVSTVIPLAITTLTGTAKATYDVQTYPLYTVGSTISIAGSSIAGYNGDKTVTACDTTSVSWTDATTGSPTFSSITRTTTAISVIDKTATATFVSLTYVPYAVGSNITITGVIPAGYNGIKTVTACTLTTVSWLEDTTISGSSTNGIITGSSTITTATPSVFKLDENVPLVASTTYTIRVRASNNTSTTRTVSAVSINGYYDTIKLSTTATAAQIGVNDLFMFGELNKESVDLLVLAIEPYGNQNAKITLVDYAETLFTTDYVNTNFTVPTYKTNITLPSKNLVQSIFYKPIITSVISDETVMEQVASGTFKINVKVGFSNPPNLPTNITHIVTELDAAGDNIDNWITTVPTPIGKQSVTISGVDELKIYKIRMRYISADGRTGPWCVAILAPITSTTWTAGVLTINTVSRHSFSVGTTVYLYNNNSGNNTLNNIYTVDSIPSKTSLTCAVVQTVTGISSVATTTRAGYAVATYPEKNYTPYLPGTKLLVTGASPTTYNGVATVTSCDSTSVSWANGNLLVCTEDFRTVWTKYVSGDTTVTYETAIPNSLGVNGVTKLQLATTIGAQRQISLGYANNFFADNTILTVSVEAKAAELSSLVIIMATKVVDFPNVVFNLSTGTVSAVVNAATTSIQNYGMDNLGNGWYRCWLTCNIGTGAGGPGPVLQLPYVTTGTVGQGIYLTRAQMNCGSYPAQYVPVLTSTANVLPTTSTVGTITPSVTTTALSQTSGVATATFVAQKYLSFAPGSSVVISNAIPTQYNGPAVITASTPTTITWAPNLISLPNDFNNATVWTPVGTTVTPFNTIVAPDGTTTADTIVFSGATNDRLDFVSSIVAVLGNSYTYSVWLKGSGTVAIAINTTTGLGGTGELSITLTSTWTKYSISHTYIAGVTGNVRVHAVIIRSATTPTVNIWGAQLSQNLIAATTQGNIVRTPTAGTWGTSSTLQLDQDLTTGQGLVSSKNNTLNNYLAENLQHQVIGKTSPPDTVANFARTVDSLAGKLNFTWAQNSELDVQFYEVRTDANWGSATNRVYLGSSTSCVATPITPVNTITTYYIKAIDYSNNYSTNYASVSYQVIAPNTVTTTPTFILNNTGTSLVDTSGTFTWAAPTGSQFAIDRYRLTLTRPGSGLADLVQEVKNTTWTVSANWVGSANLSIEVIDILGMISVASTATPVVKAAPNPVAGTITKTVSGTGIVVGWPEVSIATNGMPVLGYEIRTVDSNWGSIVTPALYSGSTNNTFIDLKSSSTPGTKTYYIRSYDIDNKYSTTVTFTHIVVVPTKPVFNVEVFADTSLTNATVTLSWAPITPEYGLLGYRLTYGSVTQTLSATSITLLANWGIGVRTYTLVAIDNLNNSSTVETLNVTKQGPGIVTNFTAKIIDNNVLLYWTPPVKTTLPIDHVTIVRGTSYAGGTSIGDKTGTFTTVLEQTGGTYTYWIAAIDTDGQIGTAVSLTATVASPPDYVFNAQYSSSFTSGYLGSVGINSNTTIDAGGAVLPVDTTSSVTTHFTGGSRSWTAPQSQIDAGFPIYIQPATTSGFYEEVFNYTKLLASSQVTLSYSGTTFNAPVITPTISTAAATGAGTGTVSTAIGSSTVTGVGTAFGTAPVSVGSYITIPNSPTGQTVRITAIASTTSMTVTPAMQAINSGVNYYQPGTWTDYTGVTSALGLVFQYVKAKLTVSQGTKNAGPGTGVTTTGTTTVTGVGATTFTSTFKVGDIILIPNTAAGIQYIIATITNNTSLTTTVVVPTQTSVTYAYYGTDLYKLTNLSVRLDAKQKTESNMITVAATGTPVSADGTVVNFNGTFIDISSITLAPLAVVGAPAALIPIYNFIDSNLAGTYTNTGTACTVNISAHGLSQGQSINFTFTGGIGVVNCQTTVATVVNANSFTIVLPTTPTANNTTQAVTIYPNSMTVYLYNTSGTRQAGTVSWTVRGF